MSPPSSKPNPSDTLPKKKNQYWRYKPPISIYHFRTSYMSLQALKSGLGQETGYTKTMYSFDPLHSTVVPSGDELPNGTIEAAYMPATRSRTGSALGFRTGSNTVEWLCFDRNIDKTYLDNLLVEEGVVRLKESGSELDANDPRKLFNLVAFVGRDTAPLKRGAQTEHKCWFASFVGAVKRGSKVRLTWKNFGTDLKKWKDERIDTEQELEEWRELEWMEQIENTEVWRSEDGCRDAREHGSGEEAGELLVQRRLVFASKVSMLGDEHVDEFVTS